jgi:predicted enzyme related to lactoylglutathione lyase
MGTRPPILVETLHTRLLVNNYVECFRFYSAVLPELTGAKLAKGDEQWPYARFDVEFQKPYLALMNRQVMTPHAGAVEFSRAGGDGSLLCFRVADVDAAQQVCVAAGATVVQTAADVPEWGEDTRIALLRDPDGNLVELQSSPD